MYPSLFLSEHPGFVGEASITAEAASALTGYNIQHIRRLCFAGKLEAVRIGRAWLIKVRSLEAYLAEVEAMGDGRFGPRMPAHHDTDLSASA